MNAFCLSQMRNQAEMVVTATVKVGYGRAETKRRRREREHESYKLHLVWVMWAAHCVIGNISDSKKKHSENDTGSEST